MAAIRSNEYLEKNDVYQTAIGAEWAFFFKSLLLINDIIYYQNQFELEFSPPKNFQFNLRLCRGQNITSA